MSGKYILVDRQVIEVDLMTWALESERRSREIDESGHDPWRVGRTWFANGDYISTVFLGLDHNWRPSGPPEIFESMLFSDMGPEDCWRCSTWDQALVQHRTMVREWSETLGAPVRSELIGVL